MADELLMKEIGTRIKRRRKQLEITQEHLAEAMDVSVQMISNLEQGKKAIRPENLVKLCRVLKVSADHILMGESLKTSSDGLAQKYERLSTERKKLINDIIDSWLI